MYVGFSSYIGAAAGSHYILGWSLCLNGREAELLAFNLPSLLALLEAKKRKKAMILYWFPVAIVVFLVMVLGSLFLVFTKRRRLAEETEEWEFVVQRISHDSRQGMKEFVAEIATIGRLEWSSFLWIGYWSLLRKES
ncbi:L-type lectin-domain containing receptor kinase V.9 [Dendrobium catenatum]|uniref:L-type lectin-domain containing receptor kinase V.9 n=1 Tax=Dendrobium catenatum TaxID=906689 RepID=A0A2I0WV98_9ASPA|nr:L-type lectin-domain containing receptor kinase V.9 [Dendrobium catenatum]